MKFWLVQFSSKVEKSVLKELYKYKTISLVSVFAKMTMWLYKSQV